MPELISPQAGFDPADPIERLQIKLKPSDQRDLVNWIDSQVSLIDTARNKFFERHKTYLYNWDDFVTFSRNKPWDAAPTLHMPLTAIKVDDYLTKLYNLFTDENSTQLVPRETYDEPHVDLVRQLRSWYLWDYLNQYRGIRGFAREVFYDCVTVGFGIGMKDFETVLKKKIEIEEFQREMADLAPQVQEAQQTEAAQTPPPNLPTGEQIDQNSVPVTGYREVQKLVTIFEGSRLRSIPFENIYFPNIIPESSNLDFPDCVVVKTEMTNSDIRLKGARGEWPKKAVDAVLERGDMEQPARAQEAQNIREDLTGYLTLPGNSGSKIIDYCFVRYDIDDDGFDEDLVVTKCEKTLLKVIYLQRISPTNMRPLFKFDCFSKPRQAYSRGVPEFLYPLNEEMDQHHNMRLAYLALQCAPFGAYRANSSLKSEPIEIAPGKFIPVDDVADIKLLNWSTNAQALIGEEDRIWHYADMQTSTSSLNQGVVPEQVGPLRSTSGVVTLLKQMDKKFVKTVDQIAVEWKKMEKMLLEDLDTRIEPAIKTRVLGASIDDARAIAQNPEMFPNALLINAAFDMKIDVARSVTSDEIRRNDAEMILNKMVAPSILQQSGVITPKGLYRSLYNWLSTFNTDVKQLINAPQFIQEPLTLYQEIQICGQGEIPPMAMQDNHQEKAVALVQFIQSPEYAEAKTKGLYGPLTERAIMQTVKKHMAVLQMTQAQSLPNPSGSNGQDQSAMGAGTAPQQGGPSPNATTSREAPVRKEPSGPQAPANGGAPAGA